MKIEPRDIPVTEGVLDLLTIIYQEEARGYSLDQTLELLTTLEKFQAMIFDRSQLHTKFPYKPCSLEKELQYISKRLRENIVWRCATTHFGHMKNDELLELDNIMRTINKPAELSHGVTIDRIEIANERLVKKIRKEISRTRAMHRLHKEDTLPP